MANKIHNAGTGNTGNQGIQTLYIFHCPGCKANHGVHVPFWKWNGSFVAPTFQPSLLCNRDFPESRCHSIITDGKIQFLSDCWHPLAGTIVEIPDWKD